MAVHRLLLCAVTIAAIAPAAAQEPDERPALKKYEYELTVSGCVKGKRLEDPVVRSAPEHLRVDSLNLAVFILDGPKELLKQIEKEHKNHNDQLIGIATIPPTWFQQQGGITSRKVGPISIGIGRQEISPMQQSTPHIRLKVSSIVHVLDTCRGGGR